MGNETFSTMEKFLFAKKAEVHGEREARKQIMELEDPVAIMKIGRAIKCDKEEWDNQAPDLIYEGLRQKFIQNESIKGKLIATGRKRLVEASPVDETWGSGAGLSDPRLLRQEWTGQNKLGVLLMRVRESLQ